MNVPDKQRLPEAARQEASNFTLAVVMTGIAALFIAGIASAFIYAKDTNPVQSAKARRRLPARRPKPPAPADPNKRFFPNFPARPGLTDRRIRWTCERQRAPNSRSFHHAAEQSPCRLSSLWLSM